MKISDQKLHTIVIALLFLFTFSGVFSIISVKLAIPILKLWKEIFIILLFLSCLLLVFLKQRLNIRKVLIVAVFLFPSLIIYTLLTINENRLLVAYQIKTDIVPFLFVMAVTFIVNSPESKDKLYNRVVRLIIITGLINSAFVFFESVFSELFMSLLAIDEFNNSGGAAGIRLDNTALGLRAMGTMLTFINSGTLTFFAIVCLLESKLFFGWKKLVMFFVLFFAMILTTYKTALLACIIYFLVKIIYSVFSRIRGAKMIYALATIIIFSSMAYVFNSFDVYKKITSDQYQDIAYNSIYLRVLQHEDILNDMVYQNNLYLGLGVGVNGTSGPSEALKYHSKPLDSTYIYIMSNYGMVGVMVYIITLLSLLLFLCAKNRQHDNIAIVLLFYSLSIEFFTNNMFANFPCNVFFYVVIYLSIVYNRPVERRKNSFLPQCEATLSLKRNLH